ncbi:Uncharacterised protein [Pantoea agglomerans]|uniref:Lipoprotein n=1 Tax=Enterobacter agglomerans TaxID=549 RepID=A0A379ADY6_ENTAG|nr:Uncharacterised protein [Pantoea agglomerans]
MKKIIPIFCCALLAGCAPLTPHECIKKSALETCSYNRSGKVGDNDIYGQQASGIKKALDAALSEPHAWKGKRCNAHLDFKIDGTLDNFIIKGAIKIIATRSKWRQNAPDFRLSPTSMFSM